MSHRSSLDAVMRQTGELGVLNVPSMLAGYHRGTLAALERVESLLPDVERVQELIDRVRDRVETWNELSLSDQALKTLQIMSLDDMD